MSKLVFILASLVCFNISAHVPGDCYNVPSFCPNGLEVILSCKEIQGADELILKRFIDDQEYGTLIRRDWDNNIIPENDVYIRYKKRLIFAEVFRGKDSDLSYSEESNLFKLSWNNQNWECVSNL